MTLDKRALNEVEKLRAEKYSTWEWNYGTSPRFTERKKMRFPWGGVEAFMVVDKGMISECSFRGDYFGSEEYAPLLSRLAGLPYTKESVVRAIEHFDTHSLFAGSSPADLIALLAPEI